MMYSFLIKTTGNRPVLRNCVTSILDKFSGENFEILIADEPYDVEDTSLLWKTDLYKDISNNGHSVVLLDETSVTKCRNHLLEMSEGDIVVRLDDDFEFGDEFDIQKLKILLDIHKYSFICSAERQFGDGKGRKDGEIRLESGHLQNFFGYHFIRMIKDSRIRFKNFNSVRYYECSYSRNCIFLKKKDLGTVRWNDKLHFEGEHLDFYLQLKANGLSGCITPDLVHWHREDLKNTNLLSMDRSNRTVRSKKSIQKYKILKATWGNVPYKYGVSLVYTAKMFAKRFLESFN